MPFRSMVQQLLAVEQRKKRGPKWQKPDMNRDKAVMKLVKKGLTTKQIVDKLGVSRSSVYRAIHRSKE